MIALITLAAILVVLFLVLTAAVKVAREYERGVIFRLGRLRSPPKGPGLFLLIPVIDKMVKVDLRTVTLNVPPQEVITKDNVPVRVNAVAYFRIIDPERAIVQIENFMAATSQIAQTTLRSVLGQHVLDELLSEREKINEILQRIIDEATAPWGIKVSIVEVKDVEIPSSMQRAMARQAEAERERRAKVINAEGEFQASERLREAADVMARSPMALQLRYLQTILELGSSQATTIVFPAPIDLISQFLDRGTMRKDPELTDEPRVPELRRDPLSGRWVAFAPWRAQRPGAVHHRREPETPDERESCPFCEGREQQTPPETFAVAAADRRPDTPGWSVRVVPNLYPAFEHHEVVVHTPRHARSFGELEPAEVRHVADAWRHRAAAARDAGYPYVQAVVNEGVAAGASLPHSHSQLAWLPEPPPLVAAERSHAAACEVCALLDTAEAEGMLITRSDAAVAVAPTASRSPYEVLIAPVRHEPSALDGGRALADGLELLRDVLVRLTSVEGPLPLNAWLHDGDHWHLELVPRLSTPASLELGAGIYINSLLPEAAAERLRGAS